MEKQKPKEETTKGILLPFVKEKIFYDDEEMKLRGRDYPPYKDGCKMSIAMSEEEVKEWFSKDELKEYPKENGYTGSLP